MGGRLVAGTIQLLMAVGGVLMVVYGMTSSIYRTIDELPPQTGIMGHLELAGFALFALSWLLAWFTSFSLLHQAPPEEPARDIPPIIPPPKL